MKNLSEETIEVGGIEYTLFLNRKGLIACERETKEAQKEFQKMRSKYQELESNLDKTIDHKADDDDPFAGLEEIDNMETDAELTIKTYKTLYWVMLYTHHKMSRSEVSKWFDQALQEYGIEQLMKLGDQMVKDVNVDTLTQNNENLKKLKALRPTK